MKIKNTSKFTSKEIRKLIKIAKGSFSLKGVDFHIKDSNKGYGGTCYGKGISWRQLDGHTLYHPEPLVVVRVNKNWNKLPFTMNKVRERRYYQRPKGDFRDDDSYKNENNYKIVKTNVRFPHYTILNGYELLLTVLAHEIFHLRHWRDKKKGSELKAERYALKKLEKYRQEDGK